MRAWDRSKGRQFEHLKKMFYYSMLLIFYMMFHLKDWDVWVHFHEPTTDLVIEALLLQGLDCGTVCRLVCDRSLATDSLGDIWKIIYLGFEKSQRSVMHDSLRYINIVTYLLTYLFTLVYRWLNWAFHNALWWSLRQTVKGKGKAEHLYSALHGLRPL